jgi:hypothetical protein
MGNFFFTVGTRPRETTLHQPPFIHSTVQESGQYTKYQIESLKVLIAQTSETLYKNLHQSKCVIQ